MGKIIALDYGKKRTGIAATDDLKIIASGLQTVETSELFAFLEKYLSENNVEELIIGLPIDLKGINSEIEQDISAFIKRFESQFPHIPIHRVDERFTSKIASFYISKSGKSKKKRQDKGLIDKISATIILQDYLESKG
ncbi:Holliday junction resolvase RuvX [Riemerella columbipharyngis]|uniref:Putative pre-16S rRNA nuclease n=1 Tax=Riemerella columbipharyngis TaxID=1071918 RepID=A0A1G7BJ00_9FLAO|nr:Holliday junction resolvase RuvX [Riemerella columbipharyngis]SDE27039.1 putative holliday junction resolvase [Riemerella columbipharyngis]